MVNLSEQGTSGTKTFTKITVMIPHSSVGSMPGGGRGGGHAQRDVVLTDQLRPRI